jgi:23S rRNA (pseudouridine1915-N3)-methyltransferase
VLLVCVGRIREPFVDDSAHYERLLGRYVQLELIELKEAGTQQAQAKQAMASEAEQIARRIPDRSFVCALDRGGREHSSSEWAGFLEQRRSAALDLCFVIGGPFGLDPGPVERADAVLSLGKLTLPHQLARVVLLEQLFRGHKILLGEPYHY